MKKSISLKTTLFLLSSLIFFACDNSKPNPESAEAGEAVTYVGNPTIDKLNNEIASNPNSPTLYAARAGAWYENENFDEGIADMEKAIELDSSRAEFYHILADMYMDYYKSRLALNTMKKAAMTFPDRIPTLLKLSEYEYILKQYNDALFTLERIRAIDPLNAEMFFMFGQVFNEMEMPDQALNAFQSAVENDPDLIDAWVYLGKMVAEKNIPLAEKYFDNAIRVDPNNIEALHAKAYYLSNQKNDLSAAVSLYKKINSVDPQYIDGYYNIGLIYLDMDSLQEAYRSFDIAVKYAPQHPDAYYHRGVAAEMLGNNPQALADYKTVLNFDPEYASAKAAVDRLGTE